MIQYSKIARQVAFFAAVTTALGLYATGTLYADDQPAAGVRTPVNEVFQFMAPDHGTNAKGYLWIPETCSRVRGIVVLCPNVPEQMISAHPAIRDACRRNDLGIVWGNPSFLDNGRDAGGGTVEVLQRVLTGLAAVSGYDEVATVPWIPMGESGHLQMVQQIVDAQPSRCIAAVCLKNPRWPKTDRTVPMLFALGTQYEFGQIKRNMAQPTLPEEVREYDQACKHEPNWPLSVIVERNSGHFSCTEPMTQAIAHYIDSACKARLSTDGNPNLRPVDIGKGCYADLPVPGHTKSAVTVARMTPEAERVKPWYFDRACAEDAQAIASVDWTAIKQLPSVQAGSNCTVKPWSMAEGIIHVDVTTSSEFSLNPVVLDAVPDVWVNAGAKLPVGRNRPVLEWLSGGMEPLGNNRFRVSIDDRSGRLWFLAVRVEASPGAGLGIQPVAINVVENRQGTPQHIAFNPLPDIQRGTVSVPLAATSDAGLPVNFFVVAGPAVVQENRLVFTPIPPRTKYPVTVTVGAWQWGTNTEPKIQKAATVYQTFHIVK